jgi:hypothetical protein
MKQIEKQVVKKNRVKAMVNSQQAISKLKQQCFTAQELQEFKNIEANILASKRAEILNSITDVDIKDASLLQRATTYAIMYDKHALLEGRATSINDTDIRVLIANLNLS